MLSLAITPYNPTHRLIKITRLLYRHHITNATLNPKLAKWGSTWKPSELSNYSHWELRIWIWYNFKPDLWMPPLHPIQLQFWNLGHPYIIPPNQATSLPCNPLKGLCPYPSHLGYKKLQNSRGSGHKTSTTHYGCSLAREEPACSSRRSWQHPYPAAPWQSLQQGNTDKLNSDLLPHSFNSIPVLILDLSNFWEETKYQEQG